MILPTSLTNLARDIIGSFVGLFTIVRLNGLLKFTGKPRSRINVIIWCVDNGPACAFWGNVPINDAPIRRQEANE